MACLAGSGDNGILGIGYFFYKKNITYFRIWLFGWGVFFIGLGPVSGITPINALIYEHWLYLPMIGFWFIVSFYLIQIFDNRNALLLKIQGRTLLVIALAVYLLFFSFQSVKRNILWGKPVDFYKDILRYEPSSTRINNNLGNTYYNQGNIGEAEFYYRKAIESGDAFAQPYYNLGTILQSRGKIDEAVKLFDRAIEINPAFYYPYQNLAFIYAQRGDLTKAADNIEKLKMIIPNNPRVYYNSALVYLALNNREKALVDVQKGLEFSSSDPEIGKLLQDLASRLKK
ncbi:MAG: Tetratricopeptide repeat protein [Candidatus Yanofskybacteria bacterium GW2011_GWA1_44_21]|nr:MAG: Tetratricopeptide repeat protein [Candidatus Yanofskybacteria bacterium GW2011_GWA1_44_21]